MSPDADLHSNPARDAPLAALCERLTRWLGDSAYPIWAKQGVDTRFGFVERLSEEGRPLSENRRARVAPRQIFSFSFAAEFGWTGKVEELLRRGLEEFEICYRRPEGLYRTLVGPDGAPKDERTLLYDQAFVLLGLAAAWHVLQPSPELEGRAVELREAIETAFRTPQGFRSGDPAHDLREANPHMHLLEACLAWAEIGRDPTWQDWADEIAELALEHFIDCDSGALTESFTPTWKTAPGLAGRLVEPGHQFEWAWLLLRWGAHRHKGARRAALRLIEVGERFGVRDGFAVNALLDDLTMHDPDARLWPQTERLKAGLLAAELTGDAHHLTAAASAAGALASYLDTPVAGLWFDRRRANGEWLVEPSPASSLYHIVCAIHALKHARRS
jgi:mannose/cellobiose epimerase-like protein (N-acyl-D-glucosamine 2-epimerase family)